MAGQPGNATSALPAAAHVVGNAFVNQYYNVLHQSPQVVHRFYTDASRLTRAEAGPDGAVDSVVTQSEIHQKVVALDYGDFKAEIVTVDSQDSLTGGVLEKGYFVLNDIFRYLDEDASQTNRPAAVVINGLPLSPRGHVLTESEPSLPTEQKAREVLASPTPEVEPLVEDIFEPAEQVEVEVEEVESDNFVEDSSPVDTSPGIGEPPSPIAASSGPVPSVGGTSEDAPKKSYASIVSYASILRMKESIGSTVSSATFTTAPKMTIPPVDRPASYSSRPIFVTSGQDTLEESSPIESDGGCTTYGSGSLFLADGRSVYVKNLPLSISTPQLEEEFGKFGLIKTGGVNVKTQKQGVCYAFIEFEESASAQTAIESSPVSIGGRQVYVEEKKPMGSKSGGRGGRPPGISRSDRSFRNEGLRGRGTLGRATTGRGPGQERDREPQFKGRGIGPMRSGSGNVGGGSNGVGGINGSGVIVTNGVDNYRDTQAGNGIRASRRGGGNLARNGIASRGGQHVAPV